MPRPTIAARGLACVVTVIALGCAPAAPPDVAGGGCAEEADDRPRLLACYERGVEARERGDWSVARDAFLEAVALAPQSPSLRLHAASALARVGNNRACLEHLEAAARLGCAADLASDEVFHQVALRPEFADVIRRLAANAAPLAPGEVVHRFTDLELWVEGIALDEMTGDIYVGSLFEHAIYRLDGRGAAERVGSPDELMEVIGIWVDGGRRALWAVTGDGPWDDTEGKPPRRNELVRLDLDTGAVDGRWPIPDDVPRLLNDVTGAADGTVWASESLRGEVYRVSPDGELELFARYGELVFLNGIAVSPDGSRLYLGDFVGLTSVVPADGSVQRIAGHDMALGMVDGLSWFDGGLVVVQNNPRVNFRVVRVDLGADGVTAERLEILAAGVPDGTIPYTSAVMGDTVWVVAGAPFELKQTGERPPAAAVVRMPLGR